MNILYARAWYSKALALLNLKNQIGSEKNFEKALEAFDAVLKINPEDAIAWQYKGNTLRYLDRPEEAIEAFEKALLLDPDNIFALYFKGLAFGYLNMPERALQAFEGVLARNPKHAGALYYSGLALNHLSRNEAALEAFTRAAELNPENLRVWQYKGLVLSTLGKPEAALEAYNKMLTLEPLHAGAWEGKAKAYFSLGRKKEALKACERALELEPGLACAYETQGKILKEIGKREEALGAFEKSLIVEPRNVRSSLEKGRLLGDLGRYREALEAFRSAFQLDSSIKETKIGKGKALLSIGNNNEALDIFRETLEDNPEDPESWEGIGNCLLVLGKYTEALEAYNKAIDRKPASSTIMNGFGEIYYKLGDYTRAEESFKQAIELDPESIFAWNGKGNALCKLEKYEQALDAYETLLALDYESLPARYNRGVALSRLINQKKAFDESLENQLQNVFKKFLELSGKIPEERVTGAGWKYRGLAFAELGLYREAFNSFENAVKTDKEDLFPYIYRGIALICLKEYDKALDAFQEAEEAIYTTLEIEWSEPGEERIEKSAILNSTQKKLQLQMLRNARGFALDALGKYEDALKAFESARRFSGNEDIKIACCGKGLVFAHLGDWHKTLKAFDRILVFDPENTQASVMKAFALIRLQKFESASLILEKLLEKDTGSDLPACLLGFACSRLENPERALWAYKKAIEVKPKHFLARNGLAELYFRLGNTRGALKELEASIAEAPENAFSRNLKGRVEIEEQACEDALESFRRALDLDSKDRRLLLWEAYARYMYAEATFEEESTRFKHMVLAVAGKLEKAVFSLDSEDHELKAYALYSIGLFYCRAHHFRKAAKKLEECLKLKTQNEVNESASELLKSIRNGPLKPSLLKWWHSAEAENPAKKAGFALVFLLILSLLLSHPAASNVPIASWPVQGREYLFFIVFLLALMFAPVFRSVRGEKEELEFEVLAPPSPDFEIPASILDEFTERLEKNLFFPEPMEERIQKLIKF